MTSAIIIDDISSEKSSEIESEKKFTSMPTADQQETKTSTELNSDRRESVLFRANDIRQDSKTPQI